MPTYDTPIFSESMVDMQTGVQRKTEHILTQNGWVFAQDGRYTEASPLSIASGSKTKITFNLSQLAYTDGRNLQLEYNQQTNKFTPSDVGSVYLLNFRLKVKPSAQNGTADATLEVPTATFNPVLAGTMSFNKAANQQHFFSFTDPIFVSQQMVENGFEIYIQPLGTNLSVYDYSLFVQKSFIPY